MRLQLTNEQLALFFDEDLKGDTISHGSRKYKITNPILEINGLYADEIEYELSETPISTEYNNTVLLTSIPMEYGVVYDSIILMKKDNRFNIHDIEIEGKHDQYYLYIDWTTYDFGTGQDYAPDDEHEDEFYKEVELYNLNTQSTAGIYLEITVERIINSVDTLRELVYEDIYNTDKLAILDGSVIENDALLVETIEDFVRDLNLYMDSPLDPVYTYVREADVFKIYEMKRSDYKNNLKATFTIIWDWEANSRV